MNENMYNVILVDRKNNKIIKDYGILTREDLIDLTMKNYLDTSYKNCYYFRCEEDILRAITYIDNMGSNSWVLGDNKILKIKVV